MHSMIGIWGSNSCCGNGTELWSPDPFAIGIGIATGIYCADFSNRSDTDADSEVVIRLTDQRRFLGISNSL
jgi:hypothetical protein